MRLIDADALVADLDKVAEECIAMEKHVPTEFKQYYRGKFEAVMEVIAQVIRHTPTIECAKEQPKEIGIDDIKRSLAEVKRICSEREYCYGCPFEKDLSDRHICKLAPTLYSEIPSGWDIYDEKEEA